MYVVRAETDRLNFGDVISAPWLFDLYLRHDAVALKAEDRGKGRTWLENMAPQPERQPGKDGVLSHADEALGFGNPRWAIILTDDCEMETLQERRTTSGRIMLAGIRPATPAEIAVAQTRGTYRRFPLPPDGAAGFAGGIVELQRIYSVFLPSLKTEPAVHERAVGLDPEAQGHLSQYLCAHATRHGPLVAAQESAKLAMLLTADGDPTVVADFKEEGSTREPNADHKAVAEALTRGLSAAWILEGRILDEVSDAWERGDAAVASVETVRAQLQVVRESIDETIRLLDGTLGAY